MKITHEVAEALKSYVYLYSDPRDGSVFYIGKGTGGRMFSHLDDKAESQKTQQIAEIRAAGLEPHIDVLRYGLSSDQAHLVEAAAIDLIGKKNLTNQYAGIHAASFPRVTSQEVIAMLTARPVAVVHRALLITINRLYRSDMTAHELYEATRGVWRIGKRRENAQYAMAVYQGIVREVYRIVRWMPAGTMPYTTRTREEVEIRGRSEFEGVVAQDIRAKYVGHFVGKGGQFPVRYVNA